ncbi:DUF2752 domain-containing protein [Cellulomonas sp. zg-ZUI222]|uniref:DUF2752 domain-containing protein n=1 Tax=Cellulomonas wangleii TaxID=2816956 RepID=UPI001A9482A0|nr:DUF2752 domain-containing protein [Cellulomonas wangleii]MBO0920874.1 DUF2752 domain-containing protein [Cellulomonas wangleii]
MTDLRQPAVGAGHAASSPLRRGALPLVLAAAAAGAATLLVVRSPYAPLSYGFCPSVLFLGVSCPGCGGLRATHSLLTGDLVAAWQANPLWTVAAPLLVVAWGMWAVRRVRGGPPLSAPTWLPWSVLVAVVGFAVLRNVPALVPYLGPAPLP